MSTSAIDERATMASNEAEFKTTDKQQTTHREANGSEDPPEVKSSQISEKMATVSQRIQHLRDRKKSSKTRLTKARNRLHNLIAGEISQSKTNIRRQIKTVKSEFDIVEKIIVALKENYSINLAAVEHVEFPDIDTMIDKLDDELFTIENEVELCIKEAIKHIEERLNDGENESDTLSVKSSNSNKSQNSLISRLPIEIEQARLAAQAAQDRLISIQQEQNQKELELQRQTAELELMKQRTEEARKLAELSTAKASAMKKQSVHSSGLFCETSQYPGLPTWNTNKSPAANSTPYPRATVSSVKLKGVELPTFSGEDKADYEPWKAAFMSIVDRATIPVSEKMLRLQNSLSGKALKLVKDLGFSENAYDKAKAKLEKKYGGERRLQIKHITSLRGWKKIRQGNLEDLEDFLTVLERVTLALEDSGPSEVELTGHNLNLTAKEKLPEEDILSYKHWLIERSLQDDLSSLVQWIELRVQVLEETKEETSGLSKKRYDRADEKKPDTRRDDRQRNRGYSASTKTRKCIVTSCEENHPPWACQAFKSLSVPERKDVIAKNKRCFRCLAAGHFSNKCTNARRCGIDGCNSNLHSSYLHERRYQEPRNAPHQQTPSVTAVQHQNFNPLSAPNSQVPPDARSYTTHILTRCL